jgi:hypothetical protein
MALKPENKPEMPRKVHVDFFQTPKVETPKVEPAPLSKFEHKLTDLGRDLVELIIRKHRAYGGSFNVSPAIVALLYPNGIKVEQYDDLLYIVRVIDKIKRIAERNDPFGENPAQDIGGYSLLKCAVDAIAIDAQLEEKQKADLVDQLQQSIKERETQAAPRGGFIHPRASTSFEPQSFDFSKPITLRAGDTLTVREGEVAVVQDGDGVLHRPDLQERIHDGDGIYDGRMNCGCGNLPTHHFHRSGELVYVTADGRNLVVARTVPYDRNLDGI